MMQLIGTTAFSVAFFAVIFGSAFNKTVSTHKSLEVLVGICGGGGFFLGLFMFIGVGARVMGQQEGVNSFSGQIFRVLWRTFIFFLLPLLILTLLIVIIARPKP